MPQSPPFREWITTTRILACPSAIRAVNCSQFQSNLVRPKIKAGNTSILLSVSSCQPWNLAPCAKCNKPAGHTLPNRQAIISTWCSSHGSSRAVSNAFLHLSPQHLVIPKDNVDGSTQSVRHRLPRYLCRATDPLPASSYSYIGTVL